jgi:hypothetical protein
VPGVEYFAVLIPLAPFALAIVAVLVNHQRKMAELIHRDRQQASPELVAEMRALRLEVAVLTDRVNQVAIGVDRQTPLSRLEV